MRMRAITLWVALVAAALPGIACAADGGAGGIRSGCIGDCNDDEQVRVDEVILGVRIALGESPDSACPNGGPGSFSINGLTAAVVNTLAGCAAPRNFSGFSEFELSQQSGLGFCPEIGDVYAARLHAIAGGVVLARALVEPGTKGVDACLETFYPGDSECRVARAEPCRRLTAAETEQVRAVFAAVKVWTAPDVFCVHGVYDPCLITRVRWDDFATSDFIHGYSRVDVGEIGRIADLLRSLGDGPEVPCPAQ